MMRIESPRTALVKPGSTVVLPLMPEYVRNEDGQEKQDCEQNAAKRSFVSERGETVLKHRGYNLEHNFGHGENHASDIRK
jgi:hypothetical protein